MSQRLSINVKKNGNSEMIGCAFKRWGAFTLDAFSVSLDISELFSGSRKGTTNEFLNNRGIKKSVSDDIKKYLVTTFGDKEAIDYSTIEDEQLRLIRICEYLGGGIDGGKDSDEWKYITGIYDQEIFLEPNADMDPALVAISPKAVNSMNELSQRKAYITVADKLEESRISTDCIIRFDSYNEMVEELELADDSDDVLQVPVIRLDKDLTEDLSIAEVKTVIESLNCDDEYCECNGRYYGII